MIFMDEQQVVFALIDRLAREAGIHSAREREEFEREILSHFEEAAASSDARSDALKRFGSPDIVRQAVRRAYRRRYVALHITKIVAAAGVSMGAALVLQVCTGFHIGSAQGQWRLAPAFTLASAFIVLMLGVAWEFGIEPLCARLERRPLRLLATFAGCVVGIYAIHAAASIVIDPGRVIVVSALLLAVWISTVAILFSFDRALLRFLDWTWRAGKDAAG